jgi:hypothetical protein
MINRKQKIMRFSITLAGESVLAQAINAGPTSLSTCIGSERECFER